MTEHSAQWHSSSRGNPLHAMDGDPLSASAGGSPTSPGEAAERPQSEPRRPSPRVLMVLYHFPPLGGVSMSRNVRNVQYLPRYGWAPVVLAPEGAGELMDPDALALVAPETTIIRAGSFGPHHLRPIVTFVRRIALVQQELRGARATSEPQRRGATGTTADVSAPDAHAARHGPSRFWRLQRLAFFPDDEVGWLPFAVAAAIRAHRAHRFDAIYSTSSPVTAHLVAGIIQRLTGLPWVAEFRDPWVGNPLAKPFPWLHRRLQSRIERWIVRSASRLVFVSPSTTQIYRRRYPRAAEMVTITNGHDASETFTQTPEAAAPRRYRIVWTGALYRPAELRMFLGALEALVARRPSLVDELAVDFLGHLSDNCRPIVDQFSGLGPLGPILHFTGFVPRRIALEALADADAALVMLGAGPGMGQFVPGKLFDYLGQSKQVLAVLPPGDARDILRELDWGIIADPDEADIERAIERLLTLPPPARLADPGGRYDRVALAGRLADALRAATEAARGARGARGTT